MLSAVCIAAFFAGFIDSISGGGGLIQFPALMIWAPHLAIPTLLGTNKFASMIGTSVALLRYSFRVPIVWKKILPSAFIAFICSFVGALTVKLVGSSEFLKPLILILLLTVVAITVFGNKVTLKPIGFSEKKGYIATLVIGGLIGFYDGFFGPGTGQFLIFLFVTFLGLNFLHASASAKVVNLATNLAAVIFFISTRQVSYEYAVPMAACNLFGSIIGAQMAILKGSAFVRLFFLFSTLALVLKLLCDVIGAYFL